MYCTVLRAEICIGGGPGPGVGDDHRVTFTPFPLSSALSIIFIIITNIALPLLLTFGVTGSRKEPVNENIEAELVSFGE